VIRFKKQIHLDLKRTLPNNLKYSEPHSEGVNSINFYLKKCPLFLSVIFLDKTTPGSFGSILYSQSDNRLLPGHEFDNCRCLVVFKCRGLVLVPCSNDRNIFSTPLLRPWLDRIPGGSDVPQGDHKT